MSECNKGEQRRMSGIGILCGICFALGWFGCMIHSYLYDKYHKKSMKRLRNREESKQCQQRYYVRL